MLPLSENGRAIALARANPSYFSPFKPPRYLNQTIDNYNITDYNISGN